MAPLAAEFRVGQRVAAVEDTPAQRAPSLPRAGDGRPAGLPASGSSAPGDSASGNSTPGNLGSLGNLGSVGAPAASSAPAAGAAPAGSLVPEVQFAPLQRGTVRYVGPVAGQKGVWVGVEWDDVHRGKHSGETGGQKYFECEQPGAGSFVRPQKITPGVPLPQALTDRYGRAGLDFQEVMPVPRLRKQRMLTVELVTREPRPPRNARNEAPGTPSDSQAQAAVPLSPDTGTPSAATGTPSADTKTSGTESGPPLSSSSSHPPGIPTPIPPPSLAPLPLSQGPSKPAATALSALPLLRGSAGYLPAIDRVGCAGAKGALRSCAAGLQELVLPDSLLSDWADVETILEELPSLRVLDLSGAHLQIPPAPPTKAAPASSAKGLASAAGAPGSASAKGAPGLASAPGPLTPVSAPAGSTPGGTRVTATSLLGGQETQSGEESGALPEAFGASHGEPTAVQELSATLHTLALNRCCLDWDQVQWVCQRLPNLSSLVLSHNRISSLVSTLPSHTPLPSLFRNLTLLDLASNGLSRWEAIRPLGSLPALRCLSLARNDFVTIHMPATVPVTVPSASQSASAPGKGGASEGGAVPGVPGLTPGQETVLGWGGAVEGMQTGGERQGTGAGEGEGKGTCEERREGTVTGTVRGEGGVGTVLFPCLTDLDLRHNSIADWASVSSLDLLPCLKKLFIVHNPISKPASETRGNAYEFIARLGGLTSLNGGAISADERRNSELAYLHGVLVECASTGGSYAAAVAAHPRLPVLLEKYDMNFGEEVKIRSGDGKGPGAKGQFVVVKAVLMGEGGGLSLDGAASKKLPASTTVRQLRALIPHLLKLKKPRDGSFALFLADEGAPSPHVHFLYSDTDTLSWYRDVQSPLIILKLLEEGANGAMTDKEITATEENVRSALLETVQ